MVHALALVPCDTALDPLEPQIADLFSAWRDSLSENTREGYGTDLRLFAEWWGEPSMESAVARLFRGGATRAEVDVLRHLAELRERGLSPATVARRRAALRSVVKMAHGMKLIDWLLEAPQARGATPRAYRDTRGPGMAAVRSMRHVASEQGGLKAPRDVALLGVLYTAGLRRAELCSLDVGDFDGSRLQVIGKGKQEKAPITLAEPTAGEVRAYLEARGKPLSGPLFASCDRAHKGDGRLSENGLWRVVRDLALAAGVTEPVSPHRLRHSCCTSALNATGGDLRRVRHLMRHSQIATTAIYDDQRRDVAGDLTKMLASAMGPA